ncbi:MAG TPA: TonB-dependent receptor, partial [Gammaproteobacteria bacterium]|nr:TonB-dependent receptor [Gammaproteobacteria bacterium]
PNFAAISYTQQWGTTVGNVAVANLEPPFFISTDQLGHGRWSEAAIFGDVTIALSPQLDLSIGLRYAQDDHGDFASYLPADAFRPVRPGTLPDGNPWAAAETQFRANNTDLGSVTTPRISIGYRPREDVYLYASHAEGFSQGAVVTSEFVPAPIVLDPEIVETREIGMRSDWLGGRVRFNATYFDSNWDGLRVGKRIEDPDSPDGLSPFGVPTSDGVADASGFEFELAYLPGERWELDFALGLLDTEYIDIGDPPANGSGLQPGIPFQYAPEVSFSLSARYRWPLASGARLLIAGNYGWMDEYQRSSSAEFQNTNPDGSDQSEPSYGLLNTRVVYSPADADWQLSVFGTNLTDEWYVNGGLDTGLFWGYDFATIGRPREVGVGFSVALN